MPFARYLEDGGTQEQEYPPSYDAQGASTERFVHSSLATMTTAPQHGLGHTLGAAQGLCSNRDLQLQLPSYMYGVAPVLAPGGGAEVIPTSMFAQGSSWFANNGFGDMLAQGTVVEPGPTTFGALGAQYAKTIPMSMPMQLQSVSPPPATRTTSDPNGQPFGYHSQPPNGISQEHIHAFVAAGLVQNPHLSISLPLAQNDVKTRSQFTSPLSPTFPSKAQAIALLTSPAPAAPLSLPLYSASGFDLLSVLARVAAHPNITTLLGPVDLTASFVVSDPRRHDTPIIYCSPNFSALTGYPESEVLNRNCRFLQSPDGVVHKGDERRYTSPSAVALMSKCLAKGRECQTSLINYKKNGAAFMNLVTIIPVRNTAPPVSGDGQEEGEVVYLVGFQVDLTEQPNCILERVRSGRYMVNYHAVNPLHPLLPSTKAPGGGGLHVLTQKDRKGLFPAAPSVMSSKLRAMLADPRFMQSVPSTSTGGAAVPLAPAPSVNSTSAVLQTSSPSTQNTNITSDATVPSTGAAPKPEDLNAPLSLLLLSLLPDFIHVMSLKGSFLYVAPAVTRVLGYAPEEMVGKSISDFCHPADVVPVMRELKESSSIGSNNINSNGISNANSGSGSSGDEQHPTCHSSSSPNHFNGSSKPRPVDLLFRAQTRAGAYVWIECRGRLHVEPGKGRKAIIMSGRARHMASLPWGAIAGTGGLMSPVTTRTTRTVRSGGGERRGSGASIGSGSTGSAGAIENGNGKDEEVEVEVREVMRECWGTMSSEGRVLSVGEGMGDVLGWGEADLVGGFMGGIVDGPTGELEDEVKRIAATPRSGSAGEGDQGLASERESEKRCAGKVFCRMRHSDGGVVDVELVLYRPYQPSALLSSDAELNLAISLPPLIYCIKRIDDPSSSHPHSHPSDPSYPYATDPTVHAQLRQTHTQQTHAIVHPLNENIFQELETSRNSSWQYEIQQLRYQNQRMMDEIASLEAEVQGKLMRRQHQQLQQQQQHRQHHHHHQQQQQQQQQQNHHHHERQHLQHSQQHIQPWQEHQQQQSQMWDQQQAMGQPASTYDSRRPVHPPPVLPTQTPSPLQHQQQHQNDVYWQQNAVSSQIPQYQPLVSLKRSWDSMRS